MARSSSTLVFAGIESEQYTTPVSRGVISLFDSPAAGAVVSFNSPVALPVSLAPFGRNVLCLLYGCPKEMRFFP